MGGQSNLNKLVVPVQTVTMCATGALFDIMASAPALELAWMEQQGIQWFQQVAPHDNYGRIKTRVYTTNESQLMYEIPHDAYNFTKFGLRYGGHEYTLTIDPSLSMPQSVEFYCNPEEDAAKNNLRTHGYAPLRASLPYNTNYYKVQDGFIRLSNPPHNGELFMEWVAPAGNYPDSMVHIGYVQPLKNYLLWKYYLRRTSGAADANRGEFSKFASLAKMYEQAYYETMREANTRTKCPSIGDIMDVMNRR